MRILIVTQKIDINDSVLGFFHRWVAEFSKHFELVTVICLQKGQFDLPSNVKVLSLGKEKKASRFWYFFNFYKYILQERKHYDLVFVHMNQEYIFLGWKIWKFLGKKILLWRNHKKGNIFTRLAVAMSDQVFCTSVGSFTAQFKKTKLMPVGIDSNFFSMMPEIRKIPRSILFLGRISPVKHLDVLIQSLEILHSRGENFQAYIYGRPTPADSGYFKKIKDEAEELEKIGKLFFRDEVANTKTPVIYNEHEIFVNLTDSGSFDKTIIEAMLCGTLVLVSNWSLKDILEPQFFFKHNDPVDLAEKLIFMLALSQTDKKKLSENLRLRAQKHSLEKLVGELKPAMELLLFRDDI